MRLSVCLGCCAVFLFKEMNEVVRILKACRQRDFVNLLLCGEKEILRGLEPLFVHISDRRQTENVGKFMADAEFAHMTVLFQILQLKGAVQMVIHIMFQLPQIGGVFFLPFFGEGQSDCPCKKFGHNGSQKSGVPQLV